MACNLYTLQGIIQDCRGNLGGVSDVWFSHYDSVQVSSAITSSTDTAYTFPMITGITVASGDSFVHYYVKKNTASMTSTLNVSENGSNYVSTELSLVFARMEAQKRLEMLALSHEDLVAIVKDVNGHYWYLGYDNPVTASAGSGETGTQKGDANQYAVTLADESMEYPYEILPSALESILG